MQLAAAERLIETVSLRSKLILLALVPMLGVLVVVGALTSSARATMNDAQTTNEVVSLATALGDVLHETQRERGGSAVYLSSAGANFSSELRQQHTVTDAAVAQLVSELEDGREGKPADLVAQTDAVLAKLADIPALRSQVLDLTAELPTTIGTYTGINNDILDVIIGIEQQQSSVDTAQGSLAYRSVLQGKEAAGIMRAQFSNAFSNDAFGEGQMTLLIKLQTRRDQAMAQFADFAPEELAEADAARRAGSAFAEVTEIEVAAFANGASGFGMDPVEWFALKTVYIDELKDLEDRSAAAILELSQSQLDGATQTFWTLVAGTLILFAIVSVLVITVVRTIIRTLDRISRHAARIADGNLKMPNLLIPGDDEIAALGSSFDSMTDTLTTLGQQIDAIAVSNLTDEALTLNLPGELGEKTARLIEAKHEQIELAAKEETHMAETVVLLGEIADRANLLLSNSDTLSSVSDELTHGAGQTSDQASSVSAASEEASAIAKSVAIALSQMQESVVEISTNAMTATSTAERAVAVSDETRQTIERLGTSSQEIGHVVDLISSIAEDTNVLALNATIEAARAGEAGKGFAVVANEVKTLANQTAEATGDIKRRVERIQADSQLAVQAIDGVSHVISEISDSQHSIASAVEQQTATTAEIAAAVDDVAKTSEEIATSITAVADASTRTSANANRTKEAAGELTELATDLARLSHANELTPA